MRAGSWWCAGEPGAGKTALLDYLGEQASGCRVAHAAGVESEMELVYAGLHQLLTPMLDRLERLPAPQANALQTAFGLRSGSAPDRFLVGLAALSLLAEVAEEHPLVCLVDDAQWLDQASAQVLGFVARRLAAESVILVFAARVLGDELAGLPELVVESLQEADARALLNSVLTGPLDPRVHDRILAEAAGNPLALVELPRGVTPAELAGGFALPDAMPLSGRIEESFRRRLEVLPDDTRRLLQLAAAEPVGDPVLMWRAAERLGIATQAATLAAEAGLVEFGARVRFRHPLVRSAAYRSASLQERHEVHRALAEATDPELDPDRRAWHWAQATPGPNEDVAAELERSAGRAQARGGVAAAAAFLQRSVALTADPARRAERALAAAQASLQAGSFDAALGLVATAEGGALDELQRARVDLLRGQVALALSGSDAGLLLLRAARRLEPFDLDLARETYLIAWGATVVVSDLEGGRLLGEISCAIRALPPPPGPPRPLDLLLDGLALLTLEGRTAGTPRLQQAAKALLEISVEDVLRWGWMATAASDAVWDNEDMLATAARVLQLVRDAGALAQLPIHLSAVALARAWRGDLAGAASLVAEIDSVVAATGSRLGPGAELRLRSLQGREAETSALIASTTEHAAAGGHTIALYAHWAAASPLQRPRPLPGGRGVRQTSYLEPLRGLCIRTGAARARRGGRTRRRRRARPRGPRAARGDDPALRQRSRPRHRSALPGAAERRRRRRRPVSRSDRSVAPHPAASRSWRGRSCSTASGCGARADASTRASSCARPTTCSPPSAWKPSPSVPALNCWPRARPPASAPSRRTKR